MAASWGNYSSEAAEEAELAEDGFTELAEDGFNAESAENAGRFQRRARRERRVNTWFCGAFSDHYSVSSQILLHRSQRYREVSATRMRLVSVLHASRTGMLGASGPAVGEALSGERLNEITERIIGSSILVHRATGPGLLESVYLACLVFELGQLGFKLQTQSPIPVVYKRVRLDCGFRADLIVEDAVIVEIKAVDRIAPIHQAQMVTYLRLSGYALGLIINFNTKLLTDGVKRVVNGFPDPTGDMRPRRTDSTRR
jgi:GxxExxY protein